MTFTSAGHRGDRHHYRVFGLSVASELPLPDLIPSDRVECPDVSIRRVATVQQPTEKIQGAAISEEGIVLNIPSAGRYLIRNGNEILVDPDPSVSDRNMRLFLLGSAFGVLLHQRGILPLHANALVFSGRAVAFMGVSGAGKSTMAAWFHDRGYPILTDDVCAITIRSGVPLVQPGIPRLRLWRDALEASGRSTEHFERSFDEDEKYNVPTRSEVWPGAVPLGAIYHLDTPDPRRSAQSIDRLSGLEAADALIANTYRGGFLAELGGTAEHLKTCVLLATKVPIYSVRRRWGIGVYEAQMALLEAHAKKAVSAT